MYILIRFFSYWRSTRHLSTLGAYLKPAVPTPRFPSPMRANTGPRADPGHRARLLTRRAAFPGRIAPDRKETEKETWSAGRRLSLSLPPLAATDRAARHPARHLTLGAPHPPHLDLSYLAPRSDHLAPLHTTYHGFTQGVATCNQHPASRAGECPYPTSQGGLRLLSLLAWESSRSPTAQLITPSCSKGTQSYCAMLEF
jgi:hypothetical protein